MTKANLNGSPSTRQNIDPLRKMKITSTNQPPVDAPSATAADESAGLKLLLQIEAEARNASTREELEFIIANETRKLTGSRQIFVFGEGRKRCLTAISGLPKIERTAPLVQDIEHIVEQYDDQYGLTEPCAFSLADFMSGAKSTLASYPFAHLLWVPFLNRQGALIGGMLLTSEREWPAFDITISTRLAETFQHALSLLTAESRRNSKLNFSSVRKRKVALLVLLLVLAALAVPVPMSTLAPFEIKAANPFVVSAPVEGVIEKILVNPGDNVSKGQPIIQFSDTILRNRLEVYQREMLVAEARLKKASQLAFSDKKERHELRMAMADLALKKSELNFALEMFERATIKAQKTGIAVYSNKQDLIGKPVVIGERIMQIANPSFVEINIDVAVNDAILLRPEARVKVFLDSDPLHARNAKVAFSDYQAHPVLGNALAFRTVARFDKNETRIPRVGVRGTAQLFGDEVPLAFYLFRRPLSALRQWIGI